MAEQDRQQWLFPPGERGHWDDIELDTLDPNDADARSILIRAEHPEWADAIEEEVDVVGPDGHVMNPRLHLAMHEAVANQIWDGEPPEVWQTASRLSAAGYDRHEALHMLASALGEEMWTIQHDRVPFDLDRYAVALDELPDSWEAERPVDDDEDEDDWLGDVALAVLAERGPLSPAELADHLDVDAEDIDDVKEDPRVVDLGDDRLASIPALLAGTVFTHRMTGEEAAREALALGVDLAPVMQFLCGDSHLHLAGGAVATLSGDLDVLDEIDDIDDLEAGSGVEFRGPEGWLGGAVAGDLVGLRLVADNSGVDSEVEVEIFKVPDPVSSPDTLAPQLAACFARFSDGDGMPVRPLQLICRLAADAPALTNATMAPLGEVLEGAGFELHGGHTAPTGADWETFDRLGSSVSIALRHGLPLEDSRALVLVVELCRKLRGGELPLDRQLARDIAGALDADIGEAFVEAAADAPEETMELLGRIADLAGSREGAQLAWVESLLARRAGAVKRAEACLRRAVAADPFHQGSLEDLAWYASDRGDAGEALRLLGRMEEDPDKGRTALLARYADASPPVARAGRNDACPCGSGRKYKQCCLRGGGRPAPLVHPLPERFDWLAEKLRWWLERAGLGADVVLAAVALRGPTPDPRTAGHATRHHVASSLVLFCDGAIHDFINERGPLLPEDERELLARWALTGPSLYEVVEARAGEAMRLRDLRNGDVVDVVERRGSTQVSAGELVLAQPVFDGADHRLVGGTVGVPSSSREAVLDALDAGKGSFELASLVGSASEGQ
ncbi:MAG: DUF1841 family protein [Acidimicrobiales bacterium]